MERGPLTDWPHYREQVTVIDVLEEGACCSGVFQWVMKHGRIIAGSAVRYPRQRSIQRAARGTDVGTGTGTGTGYGTGDGYGTGYGYGTGTGTGYDDGTGYGDGSSDSYGHCESYSDGKNWDDD